MKAVRLDSGDLADLAVQTRKMLDEAGLQRVEIFASSGLDEDVIDDLMARGVPITGFGVGTKMGVSEDAPSLDMAYKLCAYAGEGRLKLSTGKPVLPGRKQTFRMKENGRAVRDVIARADERLDGRPLLHPVMAGGQRTDRGATDLEGARTRAREELALLPDPVHALAPADPAYPVFISDRLKAYRNEIIRKVQEAA